MYVSMFRYSRNTRYQIDTCCAIADLFDYTKCRKIFSTILKMNGEKSTNRSSSPVAVVAISYSYSAKRPRFRARNTSLLQTTHNIHSRLHSYEKTSRDNIPIQERIRMQTYTDGKTFIFIRIDLNES